MLPISLRRAAIIAGILSILSSYTLPYPTQEQSKLVELKANSGDASAQFNLGFMYYFGQGVPQDYTEAVKWYRLAADQGEAKAQYNLGLFRLDQRRSL